MPRVPSPDFAPVQADTSVLAPARADTGAISPELAAVPGRQMQQAGNAMTGLGNAALEIAIRMQQDVNDSRVADSRVELNEVLQRLRFDPQSGYLTQKGYDALKRDSGLSLIDEYSQHAQKTIDDLSGKLDNDEQRRVFGLRAKDALASFRGDVERHIYGEWKHYALSAQDGIIKLSTDEAKRNWADPDKIRVALHDTDAAVVRAGMLNGEAAESINMKRKIASSQVHTSVIDAALQAGKSTYADQYLRKYKDEMTADDISKVNRVLMRELDIGQIQEGLRITGQTFAARFQPTDMDRLRGIVEGLESGGRDQGPDGTPLTSPKGAKYRMQVMPSTAQNPGFGIRPAASDTPEEYNRVGRDLLGKLVEKYGNVAQALAAYNAGPGALDKALEKAKANGAPGNWTAYLPEETQKYVKNGVAKFSAGAGASPPPTLQEWVQHAVDLLGPNARPELVKAMQSAAEHQYGVISKSIKERGEQVAMQAYQALISNGGDFNALDQQLKTAVAQYGPGKLDDIMKFAKAIGKGSNETDPELYMTLATYPEEMAKMSDAQFMQLRAKLSDTDFKKFARDRADYLNGSATESYEALNGKAVTTALNNRLTALGINPTPKANDKEERARVGSIQKYVRDSVFAVQQQTGKKMTPAEVEQHVDALFAKDLTFRRTFMGVDVGETTQNMFSMKVSDIPGASLDSLRQAFARAGVKKPTDDQLLRAYWTMKRNG